MLSLKCAILKGKIFTTGLVGYSSPAEERVLPLRLECLELLL